VSAETLGWWWDSICRESGVSFEELTDEVRDLCAACPVRSECLESALAEEAGEDDVNRHLIRGGKTPLDRYRMAVEQGTAAAPVGRKPLDEGEQCMDCGATMMSQKIWRFADKEQRRQWLSEGYARAGGYGRCTRDYKRFKRLDPAHVEAEKAYKNRARTERRAAARAA